MRFRIIPPCARPSLRLVSAFAAALLIPLPSCKEKEGSNVSVETRDREAPDAMPGAPSDEIVRHAAWTMNTTYVDKSYKRGEVLEALGGGGVAVGTALYPIKFEDFPYPIYLSQDEFGDWRFNIGEKPTLHAVRTPPPPETEEQKKAREKKEAVEAKEYEERMKNSDRWQAEEAAKARKKALDKQQAETAAEKEKEKRWEEIILRDEERQKREAAEILDANMRGAEERLKQREEQDRAVAREMEKTGRKLGQGLEPVEQTKPDEAAKGVPVTPSPKESPSETKVSPSPDKSVRLAEAKAELAALESQVTTERQRWQQASDTINRLTNFKKTPVKEGSSAYQQCLAASRIIQEVEQKAPGMTVEKTRLETLIKELEKN